MGIEIQWPLVLFTLFSGIGGGLLVPAGMAQLTGKRNDMAQFIALVASMVLLVVGGLFSLLHLEAPQNVMAAVYNLFSFSGISLELILLGLCFLVALVFAILFKRQPDGVALKVVAVLGIIGAVLLLYFCGHGYIMVSRPAWDTEMLPFAYLGTSLAAGAFAYGVILGISHPTDEQCRVFRSVVLVCGIVCALTCAAYSFAVMADAAEESAVAFWGGIVICGVVGTLILAVFSYLKLVPSNVMALAVIGLVVAIIAVLAVRIVMWETSAGYLELFAQAAMGSHIVP